MRVRLRSGLFRAVLALAGLLVLARADAWAHASLVRADPADGAIVAQPPATLKLTFSEPVSPLVMRLIGPSGEVIAPDVVSENTTVTLMPPRLRQGTHVLSWRVISADGHPVGGSILFSVGAPSGGAGAGTVDTDPLVKAAIWTAKLVLYVGFFFGIGGAVFGALIAQPRALPARLDAWITGATACGLIAAPLSLALQGLDALALPLWEIWRPEVWSVGLGTSYGLTAVIAFLSLAAGLVAVRTGQRLLAIGSALAALAGLGLALAVSGHAATAGPRFISRPSVFLHAVCVAFWIGSLLPLLVLVRASPSGDGSLRRFSRVIPYPLAALAATGVFLCFVQLDRIDALWTTNYGVVLSGKLAAIVALLALAAANRYRLVPRFEAQGGGASRPLATSIAVELAIAFAILAVVATWRFTPPPRALAAANEHVSIHFHDQRAMAQIEIEPVRARGAEAHVQVLDHDLHPITVKEVTLVFSRPAAGIEPIRRSAISEGDASWRIDDLRIPMAGRWMLRVEILISDFEKVMIEDQVELPRAP